MKIVAKEFPCSLIYENRQLFCNGVEYNSLCLSNLMGYNVDLLDIEDYKKKIDSDIALQIAHCINANPDIDDIKREILIDRLSKLSDDFPTVRTIIYPQNNKKFNMK